jgi:hypothetical protein
MKKEEENVNGKGIVTSKKMFRMPGKKGAYNI